MNWNTLLLFGILTIYTACHGQTAPPSKKPVLKNLPGAIVTGDTVSELSASILIIFQDKNNNYWFGSDGQGVYRYDGKNLIQFTSADGLSNDRIREIQEDKSGNIYITALYGITQYDGKTFTILIPDSTHSSDWKLQPDDLWFKGEPGKNGPYRYDGKTLYYLRFPKHYLEDEYRAKFPNQTFVYTPYEIYTSYKDKKGVMWFGTGGLGICRYDGKTLSWIYEQHLTEIAGGGSLGIRSITEDRNGNLWFTSTKYRYHIDPDDSVSKGYRFVKYARKKGIDVPKDLNKGDRIYYMSAIEDNNDRWMVTYNNGVWRFDGKNLIHYSLKENGKVITTFSIYKDNQGTLWLGTHENGAYKYNGRTFEKFIP